MDHLKRKRVKSNNMKVDTKGVCHASFLICEKTVVRGFYNLVLFFRLAMVAHAYNLSTHQGVFPGFGSMRKLDSVSKH